MGSYRKNIAKRSEASGGLERGKGRRSPDYLLARFASPSSFCFPFSHNAEPGPRLLNNYLSHNSIVQQHFLLKYSLQGVPNQAGKFRKFQGVPGEG